MGRQAAATLADHVRELRTRFFIVAVIFLAASSLAYVFRQPILQLLLSPLEGQKLIYLNPAGGFNFVLLISIYTGLALTTPVLIQQLYAFLKPALPASVQHYAGRLFVCSLLLLASGIAFGYYLAIPGALHFLYGFADQYVTASLTADSYLNFIIAYTIGLGLVFQLPLFLLFFHWIKPLTPSGLLKSQRWVILFAFIAAAIITPTPDPLNQTVIAVPVIGVYQLGAGAVLVSIGRQSKRNRVVHKRAAASTAFKERTTQVIVPTTPAPRPRRAVDGFVTPTRVRVHHPQSLARTAAPRATPRPASRAPRRSVDGMLMSA